MPRLRHVLPFTPLVLAISTLDEALGLLVLLASVGGLTVLIAFRLRPSMADPWSFRAISWADPFAILIALAVAVSLLGLSVSAMSVVVQTFDLLRGRGALALQPWVAAPLFALASGPALLWLWRARPGGTTTAPPLWPSAVGIMATVPLVPVSIVGVALLTQMFRPYSDVWSDGLQAAIFLPGLMMIAAPCGLLWSRAARADGSMSLTTPGLLEAGLTGATIVFLVPIGLVVWRLISQWGPAFDGDVLTLGLALFYLLVVAGVWRFVFLRLAALEEDNFIVILLALATLAIAVPISFALAYAIQDRTDGWGILLAVLGLPILALQVVAMLALGRIIGLISRRTRRFTVATSPIAGSTG